MGKDRKVLLTGDTDLARVVDDLDYSQLAAIFRQLFPDRDPDEIIRRVVEMLARQHDQLHRRPI